MKLIICALIIALIVVTALLIKNKITVYMLTMWMVENDYPTPEKEDGPIIEYRAVNSNVKDGEEFFDAIDAGEIEVEDVSNTKNINMEPPKDESAELRAVKSTLIAPSFKGYEDPIRERLKMDADDRPKISLWVSCEVSFCFFLCQC